MLATVVGLLAALWTFLWLTGEVREGDTSSLDSKILLALRTPTNLAIPIGPRWMQESARDLTALGGFTVLTLVVVMAVVILALLGRRAQALVLAVTVLFAQAASALLKVIIHRPRPELVPHIDLVYSSSFPSGHAMMTPVVYLTLAAIVAAGHWRRAIKAVLLIAAIVLVFAVGASRVYLGVHWPSDVLAGWTLGSAIALAAWLALYLTTPAPALQQPSDEVGPVVAPADAAPISNR
ncbi:MAG TPA: phosphatase PAP2 family protein [Caulobacteraceae bacterium]|jgi:undecaprenyl-diphosphatase|nr:phosphatase PAP2 family protein [Caulobacteraceae bacterium]